MSPLLSPPIRYKAWLANLRAKTNRDLEVVTRKASGTMAEARAKDVARQGARVDLKLNDKHMVVTTDATEVRGEIKREEKCESTFETAV